MIEQGISHKTSILAKAKGFDIRVPRYFDFIGHECDSFKFENWNKSEAEITSRPNQSMLETWIRDNHQIYIVIDIDCTTEPKFFFNLRKFVGNPRDLAEREWYWVEDFYTIPHMFLEYTYEKALEKALYEALTRLPDVIDNSIVGTPPV